MHTQIMELIIGYTLVGAFVFTVIVTIFSMLGWVKFADKAQQQKLFSILVVELVIGILGFFFSFLNYSPGSVETGIKEKAKAETVLEILASYVDDLTSMKSPDTMPESTFLRTLKRLEMPKDTKGEKERIEILEIFEKNKEKSPEEIFRTDEQNRHRIEAFIKNLKIYMDKGTWGEKEEKK